MSWFLFMAFFYSNQEKKIRFLDADKLFWSFAPPIKVIVQKQRNLYITSCTGLYKYNNNISKGYSELIASECWFKNLHSVWLHLLCIVQLPSRPDKGMEGGQVIKTENKWGSLMITMVVNGGH